MRWSPGSLEPQSSRQTIEQLPSFLNWAKGTAGEGNSIWTLQLGEKVLTSHSLLFLGRSLSTTIFFIFLAEKRESQWIFTWKLKRRYFCEKKCNIFGWKTSVKIILYLIRSMQKSMHAGFQISYICVGFNGSFFFLFADAGASHVCSTCTSGGSHPHFFHQNYSISLDKKKKKLCLSEAGSAIFHWSTLLWAGLLQGLDQQFHFGHVPIKMIYCWERNRALMSTPRQICPQLTCCWVSVSPLHTSTCCHCSCILTV